MFYDRVKIYVKGGDGGNGVVAFRREKFVPRGGPAGGKGGKGGDVYLVVEPTLNTLYHLRFRIHNKAGRGQHGGGSNKTGAQGDDKFVPVPPGTLVYDAETGDLLADLTQPGQKVLVARGGRGGRGNVAFRTSTHQAPRIAEKGETGEERWLRLELKLIADAGIVGIPNAGKSTLLTAASAARPKIADYPFTTLVPMLGVVVVDHRDFVLADIPGLVEGAHDGTGLGHEFLRHVERCRVLIHLLNGLSPDPLGDLEAINQELTLFNPALAEKPQIVVFNKMDMSEAQQRWSEIRAQLNRQNVPNMAISALTGENVPELMGKVLQMLDELPAPAPEPAQPEIIRPSVDEKAFTIERDSRGVWIVSGREIERAAAMTNWQYYEAAMRFQRILEALGISQALEKAGIAEGDSVRIGTIELTWGTENAFGD